MTENIYFTSADTYIETASTKKERIAKIDQVIDALTNAAIKAAGKGHISEYMLNDGQTIIKSTYRSLTEIHQAIRDFIQLKNLLINQLTPRVVRLVDGKNFRR